MHPVRPSRVPRRPRTVAAAMGLALLAGLLHVILLPATPAAAAPPTKKMATWNPWGGKVDTLNEVPGLIKEHDLDLVALQEVADGDLLGKAPAVKHDVDYLSPGGDRVGAWRVDEFQWDDFTIYRIITGSN